HLVSLPPDKTFLVDDPPVGDCDLGDPPLEPLLDQENDRNEREGVRRIPPKSRQEPRIAEPKSDHRQECDRTARPVHYPMNGRDVPDLVTGLQDALNIAHDNDSPSTPPVFYTPSPCQR